MIYSWGPVHWLYVSDQHVHQIKPRSHCSSVRPSSSWQFVAGRPGRTRMNREGIWRRSYIPGSAINQTPLGAKFITICPGYATVCEGTFPVVWTARVGATMALLLNKPWPSRETPYLYLGHSSCRFTTVPPSGPMVEIRIMLEELQWCRGISRRCFAPQCVPVSSGCF